MIISIIININYTLVSITNPISIYKAYNLVEVKIAKEKGYNHLHYLRSGSGIIFPTTFNQP